MELNDLHKQMLQAEKFHVDGWTSGRGRKAAAELEESGYLKSFVNQESQYTAVNFTITDTGRAALAGAN